jgi:hypothetical protein
VSQTRNVRTYVFLSGWTADCAADGWKRKSEDIQLSWETQPFSFLLELFVQNEAHSPSRMASLSPSLLHGLHGSQDWRRPCPSICRTSFLPYILVITHGSPAFQQSHRHIRSHCSSHWSRRVFRTDLAVLVLAPHSSRPRMGSQGNRTGQLSQLVLMTKFDQTHTRRTPSMRYILHTSFSSTMLSPQSGLLFLPTHGGL